MDFLQIWQEDLILFLQFLGKFVPFEIQHVQLVVKSFLPVDVIFQVRVANVLDIVYIISELLADANNLRELASDSWKLQICVPHARFQLLELLLPLRLLRQEVVLVGEALLEQRAVLLIDRRHDQLQLTVLNP